MNALESFSVTVHPVGNWWPLEAFELPFGQPPHFIQQLKDEYAVRFAAGVPFVQEATE